MDELVNEMHGLRSACQALIEVNNKHCHDIEELTRDLKERQQRCAFVERELVIKENTINMLREQLQRAEEVCAELDRTYDMQAKCKLPIAWMNWAENKRTNFIKEEGPKLDAVLKASIGVSEENECPSCHVHYSNELWGIKAAHQCKTDNEDPQYNIKTTVTEELIDAGYDHHMQSPSVAANPDWYKSANRLNNEVDGR